MEGVELLETTSNPPSTLTLHTSSPATSPDHHPATSLGTEERPSPSLASTPMLENGTRSPVEGQGSPPLQPDRLKEQLLQQQLILQQMQLQQIKNNAIDGQVSSWFPTLYSFHVKTNTFELN